MMDDQTAKFIKIQKPKLILCDIEGTTSSISFVKCFLFPYVRQNLFDYLESNWQNNELIESLLKQYRIDSNNGENSIPFKFDPNETNDKKKSIENIVKYVNWLMDHDKKITALKQLQGQIWSEGYQRGKILGHVYDDVPDCFRKWSTIDGIKIGIYSSGSILAQKLLFGHSVHGDLTKYISYYFDTNIGHKQESSSYEKILQEVNLTSSNVIFLTDAPKEAQAADIVGIQSILLERPGVIIESPMQEKFPCIQSFDKITFTS